MPKHLTADKVVAGDYKKKVTIPKGSEVKVIAEHGDTIIVEHNGVKFPINKMYLK